MFIDVHSHLEMCENLDRIIWNARKNDVKIILTCGVDIKTNRKSLEISEKFPEVKSCLGIYPSDCLKLSGKEIDSEIEFIGKNKNKIIAIGEVGLDLKHIGDLDKQKENLGKFILLAKRLKLPVIIHSRKTEKEAVDFLENFNYKKIVMHCFSGNMKLIKRIVENGWSLSVPTNVKNSEHFQKMIEIVPIENLFCETDSPFLHPDKLRNNEPTNVIESYKKIAEIKKIKLIEVEKRIERNFERVFG